MLSSKLSNPVSNRFISFLFKMPIILDHYSGHINQRSTYSGKVSNNQGISFLWQTNHHLCKYCCPRFSCSFDKCVDRDPLLLCVAQYVFPLLFRCYCNFLLLGSTDADLANASTYCILLFMFSSLIKIIVDSRRYFQIAV